MTDPNIKFNFKLILDIPKPSNVVKVLFVILSAAFFAWYVKILQWLPCESFGDFVFLIPIYCFIGNRMYLTVVEALDCENSLMYDMFKMNNGDLTRAVYEEVYKNGDSE